MGKRGKATPASTAGRAEYVTVTPSGPGGMGMRRSARDGLTWQIPARPLDNAEKTSRDQGNRI